MNHNTLQRRIAKIEAAHARSPVPNAVVANTPIPESDHPINAEVIDRWLRAGLAHIAFGGRAVFYDGGLPTLTSKEWEAKYEPEANRES